MSNIIIIPIGDINLNIIQLLVKNIPIILNGTICTLGEKIDLPFHHFDFKRNQFLAETILVQLILLKERKNYDVVLGILDYDIYTHGLNYVFGEVIDSVGIISLTRLKPQYDLTDKKEDLYKKRTLTEAIHELGHIFGLKHCNNPNCVMHFSDSIKDTDKKGFNLCNRCKNLIKKRDLLH